MICNGAVLPRASFRTTVGSNAVMVVKNFNGGIILGNNERYDIYAELKSSDVNCDSELNSVIGEFMREWIRLEAYVSQLTIKKDIRTRPFSPSSLKKIIPEKDLKKVLELRRKRNLIVHGMKLPPAEEIKYMTKEVSNICKSLEDMNRV